MQMPQSVYPEIRTCPAFTDCPTRHKKLPRVTVAETMKPSREATMLLTAESCSVTSGSVRSRTETVATQPEVFTPAHCSWGSADSRAFFIFSLRTARREAPKRMPLSPAASRISRVGVFTLPSTRTKKIRVGRKIAAARNTASPHRSIGRARSRFSVQYAPIRRRRCSVSPRFSLRASSVR